MNQEVLDNQLLVFHQEKQDQSNYPVRFESSPPDVD